MGKQVMNVIHVALDVNQLDDSDLEDRVSTILQTAPQGTLYASSPAIQACVGTMSMANDAYKAAGDVVVADKQKLVKDEQAVVDSRAALVTTLVQFKGLVETSAKNVAEVKGAGVAPLVRAMSGAIAIPTGIDILYPKQGHGRAKVTVQFTSNKDRHDAQVCLEPITQNTWIDLDGDGRSHWLTGFKSGTVLWVRFRAVRGHQKSDWCQPVPVTIP